MAYVGLKCLVVAKLSSHTPGSEPTYEAGRIIGKMIQANLNITRGNNPLHADDEVAEDDNSITAMSVELGVDDIMEDDQAYMGLVEAKTTGTGEAAVTTYYDTDAPADDCGTGYIRVRRKGGKTSYQGIWIYSTKYGFTSENAQTKAEQIQWQTPTVTGNARPLLVDDTGRAKFRKRQNFTAYADAFAWIKGLGNVPAT